jgi:hypothetical protein
MFEISPSAVQIEEDWFSGGSSFWGYGLWLFNLASNFFTLLILNLLLGKTLDKMVYHSYQNKSIVLATGVGYLFGVPLLAAYCLFTLLGLPFGLLLLAVLVLSLWLGNGLAALLLAHYLNSRNLHSWNFWTLLLLSLAMVTVMDLLVLIPVFGLLVYLLILAVTYGVLLLFIWDTQLKDRVLIR